MSISKIEDLPNGACKLRASEDMSIYSASQNHSDLVQHFDNFNRYEIDLSAVEEIDSSGIQLLLALKYSAEKESKQMVLSSASPAVDEIMTVLNIKDQFEWCIDQ